LSSKNAPAVSNLFKGKAMGGQDTGLPVEEICAGEIEDISKIGGCDLKILFKTDWR
jgi:hypothetical protein